MSGGGGGGVVEVPLSMQKAFVVGNDPNAKVGLFPSTGVGLVIEHHIIRETFSDPHSFFVNIK